MYLHEIVPGTPEADALAQKILTTLCEIYASHCGYEIGEITFEKKEESKQAPCTP